MKNGLKVAVASGKGGTGKTTIACGLASVIDFPVYIDCDVEEPNGHILLKPEIHNVDTAFKLVPSISVNKCSLCTKCIEVCEFNALFKLGEEIYLLQELCHSCGACSCFCPENAITEQKWEIGKIRSGKINDKLFFFDGILKIGEQSAPPLIRQVKEKLFSGSEAPFYKNHNIIVDSPPGTSCPLFESIKEVDFCILVTESTPFGLNDLKLAVDVIKESNIPFGIVINKYDPEYPEIEQYLQITGITLLLKIPFSKKVAQIYSRGTIPSYEDEKFAQMMKLLWMGVGNEVDKTIRSKVN